jgi:diguanylate cyclase (GGDEF)-like protein
MPETNLEGAIALGERLLGRLSARPIVVLDQTLATTLSVGVSSAEGCNSLEELMAKADGALYRAKKEGRARVCRAE